MDGYPAESLMNDYIQNRLLGITQKNQTEKVTIDKTNTTVDEETYNALFESTQRYIVEEKLPELGQALATNDFEVLRQLVEACIRKKYPSIGAIAERFNNVVAKCMADMTGYGFLNRYFADKDNIEEININGWDAVEVRWCDGRRQMVDDHFHNAQHAKDVILRILQQNNKHMDENKVYEISYIGKAVRIATTITPIADKEIGVVASIRFIHSAVYDLDTLVQTRMFNNDAASAMSLFLNHGVSMCFCGSTGSGKTTVCNALLANVPNQTRVITLEGGTREFDLIRRNDAGKVINNRVHLQTRPHRDQALNVDLQLLLDLILKFDPDIVAVGEMVSEEAFIASETARTGHTVVTTIHTNNAYDAYYRMYTLGIRKYELDEKIMLKFMVDAFPVIVYTKQYSDGKRRIQTILEGQFVDGEVCYNELYRYRVDDNIVHEDGTVEVVGEFERVNPPTDRLKQILLNNGLSKDIVDKL